MEAMGPDERPPNGTLIARLLERPQGFNLFQAISLLERAVPDAAPLGEGGVQREGVRLSSLVSLGFQPSDISSVTEGAASGEEFTLSTPVLSLAGAQGPLPLPFTEMVLERNAARDRATADFLDIFNHRFLAFLYRSRKKHHIGLSWRSPEASTLASCLDALSALGLEAGIRGPKGQAAWLRHAGLLGGAPRSVTGLLVMLSDRLGIQAHASQFCGGWQDLDHADLSRLGTRPGVKGARLGQSAVLGSRYWDQSAGIELEFSDLGLPRLERLLPGGDEFDLLKWMILRYVQQELHVVLVLRPDRRPLQPTRLGGHQSGHAPLRLGWTSWLLSGPTASTIVPPVRLKLMNAVRNDEGSASAASH